MTGACPTRSRADRRFGGAKRESFDDGVGLLPPPHVAAVQGRDGRAVGSIDLDAIRGIVDELPGSVEGTWYGAPAFRVNGRVFARIDVNDGDLLIIRAGRLYRDAFSTRNDERFGLTGHPPEHETSVVVRLSRTTAKDVDEVEELLAEAWQLAVDARLSKSGREQI